MSALAAHATQTIVTIVGAEQGSAATAWDVGTLTLTVNGHSEVALYGQFSTPASVASYLAAKFSADLSSPLVGKASGNTILFETKQPEETFSQISTEATWNSSLFTHVSFDIAHAAASPPLGLKTPSLGISCDPSPAPAGGGPISCSAIGMPSDATGQVSFSMGSQSPWSTAQISGGFAPASPLVGLAPGQYTVQAAYTGDGTYAAASQTTALTVLSGSSLAASAVYAYSISTQPGGAGTAGYATNGDVVAYVDSVNGQWSFQYDSLNRLVGGALVGGSAAQSMCWAYDSFGNRTSEAMSATAFANGVCPTQGSLPAVNAEAFDAQNHVSGDPLVVYDNAGNVVNDHANSYVYDADGRVCAVGSRPASGGTVMYQYIYDAAGNRVAKGTIQSFSCDTTTNGFQVTNSYVLGAGGEPVTEMKVAGGALSWDHSNVYAAGMLVATYDPAGLHFQVTDWLGTRRVQTDAFGQVEQTCTNLPYGNGQSCTSPATAPSTADDATEHSQTAAL